MRKSIDAQRKTEIRAGFSPKPITSVTPIMAASPSSEPDTPSPNALLDGPVIMRDAPVESPADVTVQNGIVSFGK